jgi:AraC-like DNA-binding protein
MSNSAVWTHSLDDLVDYIRQNAHLNLTLTDLEEQSHYSGRHLQDLFREKFDCTPMQFVRRQRLSAAMERLQTADENETVTNVARDFGYAYSSNFTTDFHREFGVTPSIVLRSTRGGGRR